MTLIRNGRSWVAPLVVLCAVGFGAREAAAAILVRCTASASGINFGVYDPFAGSGLSTTGSLAVNCTGQGTGRTQVTVTVSLSPGSSANYGTRTMGSPSGPLDYNIYWDPQHTVVMGDGTGGSYYGTAGPIQIGDGGSVTATGTMYGYVPPNQNVSPGSYLDVIVVTVTY
ncbi:MAG: spore coat protein U domain-containing protein [Gammaproteobacteria bacterium]|nr:spore coat protein U domain-containing protein [Gammaproteobacteria bacterium]